MRLAVFSDDSMNISSVLNLWNGGFDTSDISSLLGVAESEVWNAFAKLDRAGLGKDGDRRDGTDLLRALGELAEDGLVTADQAR